MNSFMMNFVHLADLLGAGQRDCGKDGARVGDRYWSEILAGDPPVEAAEADWEMVEAKAKTKIPAGITHSLPWNSPHLAGMTKKMRFSFKTAPATASPSG
jgi:hypothetical protein